jgi:hypothetical protein
VDYDVRRPARGREHRAHLFVYTPIHDEMSGSHITRSFKHAKTFICRSGPRLARPTSILHLCVMYVNVRHGSSHLRFLLCFFILFSFQKTRSVALRKARHRYGVGRANMGAQKKYISGLSRDQSRSSVRICPHRPTSMTTPSLLIPLGGTYAFCLKIEVSACRS